MRNLTLDAFWIIFMPMYQHIIGTITVILTVIAVYLMAMKTPECGRPLARYLMFIQVCILTMDAVMGVLLCPIYLFPLTAFLCNGLLCETQLSRHIGTVLLFQCMAQVAMSVFLTLHFKYTTIAGLTNVRHFTNLEKGAARVLFCVILEAPVATIARSATSLQGLHSFLEDNQQFSLASQLKDYGNLHGVAVSKPLPIILPILVSLLVTAAACSYFGCRTLLLLSTKGTKTSSMSEKTRKIQQSLTYTLLMQLSIPLGIQLVPICACVISQTFFLFTPAFANCMLCMQLCHASFHTTFLILTTPSYRNAVIAVTPCKKQGRRNSIDPLRDSTK